MLKQGGLSALEFPVLGCGGQCCMEWACPPQLLVVVCFRSFQLLPGITPGRSLFMGLCGKRRKTKGTAGLNHREMKQVTHLVG